MEQHQRIYYCHSCGKVSLNLNTMIFVEQSRYRGFCSEPCIVDFFQHLISYFDLEERKMREELELEDERVHVSASSTDDYESFVEQTLRRPDEIWGGTEELSEEIYYFFKEVGQRQPYTVIVSTLMFEGSPSFILKESITRDPRIVAFYKRGVRQDELMRSEKMQKEEVPNIPNAPIEGNHFQDISVDSETLDYVEGKKSQMLAFLMKARRKDDIPFEDFHSFDDCLQDTLEHPDEVYLKQDEEKEGIYTYIKGHERKGVSFYYIVICMRYKTDSDLGEETLIPILSFPSVDPEIYRLYKNGKKIEGPQLS